MIILKKGTVHKLYGGQLTITIKDAIEIRDDNVYILFGQNGIGKSSFGKILSKLEKADSDDNEYGLFLFHPQDALFLPGTGRENLNFFLSRDEVRNIGSETSKAFEDKGIPEAVVKKIGHFLGAEILDASIDRLSGGQKQLLLFVRTLLIFCTHNNNYRGIIFDEPAKELSSDRVKFLTSILSSFNIKQPLMFISHDFNFIYSLIAAYIEKEKAINFLEFSEDETAAKGVKAIDVRLVGRLSLHDLPNDWNKLVEASKYIKDMFGITNIYKSMEQVEKVKANPAAVSYCTPTFHGLFETQVNCDGGICRFLTIKGHAKGQPINPNDILCALT